MNTKHRILLVEDDPPIVSILRQRLEKEGFDLMLAGNGEEGLRIALDQHPEVILLDIVMPKMDGLEMLKLLLRHMEERFGLNPKKVLVLHFMPPSRGLHRLAYC